MSNDHGQTAGTEINLNETVIMILVIYAPNDKATIFSRDLGKKVNRLVLQKLVLLRRCPQKDRTSGKGIKLTQDKLTIFLNDG